MSDDERGYRPDEQHSGPTEAMRQMEEAKQRRSEREQEELREYEEMRRAEKEKEEEEIRKLKEKRELRKVERVEEEKRLTEQRVIEEARRKTEEEERKKKKEAEQAKKMEARAAAMKEAEKLRNPPKPNFVITKRAGGGSDVGNVVKAKEDMTKSKEQLEEEKKAILSQRVQQLSIDGFSSDQLTEKAKDLYNQIYRLESEKYDLEERFKRQQYDMMELAERARQMNKGGKGKNMSRVQETDDMASKIPGAPPKISMYSKYERQKDLRSYGQKKTVFKGPTWAPETERILPGDAPAHEEEEEED